MSRYLADAARALKKAEEHAEENLFNTDKNDALRNVASGFAALAAIDKGLLPAEIAQDVITAVISRPTV